MTQLAKFGSLRGKRVFITGGGTGIGEAMVISFAEQGAQVAFVDIARDASMALIRRVKEAGYPEPLFRQCDITDIAALQNTMSDMVAAIGDFDILVNNAANDQRHETAEVTVDYWNERIAINQRPMFFTCQAVLAGMKKKGAGSIINVGSISWHVKNAGYPVYATSKAAVHGLTRGLAARVRRPWHPRQHRHPGLGDDPTPDRPVAGRRGRAGHQAQPMPADQADAPAHRIDGAVPRRRRRCDVHGTGVHRRRRLGVSADLTPETTVLRGGGDT